jgi:hypothetical protein
MSANTFATIATDDVTGICRMTSFRNGCSDPAQITLTFLSGELSVKKTLISLKSKTLYLEQCFSVFFEIAAHF